MASLEQNQKAGEKIAKDDGELGVLSLVVGAFEALDDKEVSRALRYLSDRYTKPVSVTARTGWIQTSGGTSQPLPPIPQNVC